MRSRGDELMKKIEAIIKPFKIDAVKASLSALGIYGLTVSEVKGCGRQKGKSEHYRGSEYTMDLLPKVKLEVIVRDDQVRWALKAIQDAARTGTLGDGKIIVLAMKEAVRIRTGERGRGAI
jgi:nitrogen regulatory protein P-II 1